MGIFELIIFILIISAVVKKVKGNNSASRKTILNGKEINTQNNQQVYRQPQNNQQVYRQPQNNQQVYRQPQNNQQVYGQPSNTPGGIGKAEQLSTAQLKYQQRVNEYKQNVDIMSRAKENASKLKEDTTLKELEKQHNHSETKSKEKVEHSRNCQTLQKDLDTIVPQESLLGSVEDLMITGYSGNLNFERDFVGEGLDMISNFAIMDTKLPDREIEDVKKGA